jgi:hypothetical protein
MTSTPRVFRTFPVLSSFKPAFRAIAALVFAGLLCVPHLHAQYRGAIQGVVTDPSGAVVPGAKLTLTNPATNQTQTATSNGAGVYNFNALPPGSFTLKAEHPGFLTKTYNNVQIIPEQTNSFNVQLAISTSSQTVTVNAAETPLLDAENPTIGATISSNQIQHMPTFGRDVFQVAQLAPGTISDMSQGAGGGTFSLPGTQGPGGPSANGGIFQTENGPQALANGNQYENNSIQVDGISTVSAVWGGTSVITPSEDSVDDVHIMTNQYDAEYGRFAGAQIQVTTKSGTNHVHGSAFFQRWSPGMNAYQRYNGPGFYATCKDSSGAVVPCSPKQRGLLRDQQQFNQMGGSLGGPLWRNKVFAFFTYEGERSGTIMNTSTGWYETPQFDALTAPGPIASQYLKFPGASVSGTQISESCANIGLTEGVNCATVAGGLNLGSPMAGAAPGTQDPSWKGPSSPGVGGGLTTTPDIANYTAVDPTTITNDQFNGRVDANLSSKDRLTGTLYWVPASQTDYNGPVRPMNFWHHNGINDAFTGIWNHIFNANMLNEARANAAGWRWNEVSTNPQAPFGLPQDNIDQLGSITNFQYFGAPPPSILDQWTYTYSDILTKIAGRHSLKFGGEITRLYYLNNNPGSARPTYNFFNLWDFLNDAPQAESGTFNPTVGTPTVARQDDRENLWGAFVQDNFKASPNLTLNVGLRYNYFGSLYSKQGNMYVVHFGTGSSMLTGLTVQRNSNLWTPQKWNFGPEFGFAYSPRADNGKLVFRGGFGLNYNQEEIAISANVYGNPGLTISPNFVMDTPSAPNPGILYATATNIHSLFGYPPNPNVIAKGKAAFAPNGLPSSGVIGVTAFPSTLPTMYVMHYSFDMEYDLGLRNVFTLGYSGSQSRHTFFHYDENAVASVHGIPLNPQVNSVNYFDNNGHANYNSMIATIRHEMSNQFTAEADYNWARSLDTSSAPYEMQDYPYDPQLTYGPSDYNVGNSVKIFGMWQPVFFHGSHGWAEKVAGGWSLSGIFNWHTGFPWTPIFPVPGNLYCSTCGYSSLLPAAYLGGAGHNTSNSAFKSGPGVGSGINSNFPNAAKSGNAFAYFTPPSFTLGPAFPATGAAIPQPPGIGRNSMRGPRYKDVDATITKTFGLPKLREGAGLQFRADAFNLFNFLNFNPGSISNNITAPNFGQAQAALGGRIVTLQASFNF